MAAEKKTDLGTIKLKNVRISFAHIYEPQEGKVDEKTGVKGEDKYNCSFLIPKSTPEGKALIAQIKKVAEQVKRKKWGDEPPKLRPDKVCMRDGDLEDWDGYADHVYVSASNKNQPTLADNFKITDERTKKERWAVPPAGRIYSGCYVNAVITSGRRTTSTASESTLRSKSFQFFKKGESFGAGTYDADDYLDDDDVEGADDVGYDDDDAEENTDDDDLI